MKSIRTLSAFARILSGRKKVYVSIKLDEARTAKLQKVGFPALLQAGQTLLPKPIGPKTKFNAEGKHGKYLKDQPKVPYTIERLWEWTDWQDNPHSKIVYQNRMKWQREFIEPSSIELTIANLGEQLIVRTKLLEISDEQQLIAAINVFLEIFGDVEFLDERQVPIFLKLVQLNWELLPKGELPWQSDSPLLVQAKKTMNKNKAKVCEHRLSSIERHKPDTVAIGRGGFQGYIVYGFDKLNIFILESMYRNNATYVLDGNWEQISRLSKKEILDKQLHQARIIHNESWVTSLNNLFRKVA